MPQEVQDQNRKHQQKKQAASNRLIQPLAFAAFRVVAYQHSILLSAAVVFADLQINQKPNMDPSHYEQHVKVKSELAKELILRTLASHPPYQHPTFNLDCLTFSQTLTLPHPSPYLYSQKPNMDRSQYEQHPKVTSELDKELILRTLAFSENWKKFKPKLKMFLNLFLDDFEAKEKKQLQDVEELQVQFDSVMNNKSAVVEQVKLLFEDEKLGDFKSLTNKKFGDKAQLLKEAYLSCLKQEATPPVAARLFPPSFRQPCFDAQKGRCPICDETIERERVEDVEYASLDHIEPHSKGGSTDRTNCQLVHKMCNSQKGNRS
eukprot:gene7924-1136_t